MNIYLCGITNTLRNAILNKTTMSLVTLLACILFDNATTLLLVKNYYICYFVSNFVSMYAGGFTANKFAFNLTEAIYAAILITAYHGILLLKLLCLMRVIDRFPTCLVGFWNVITIIIVLIASCERGDSCSYVALFVQIIQSGKRIYESSDKEVSSEVKNGEVSSDKEVSSDSETNGEVKNGEVSSEVKNIEASNETNGEVKNGEVSSDRGISSETKSSRGKPKRINNKQNNVRLSKSRVEL